MIKNNKYKLLYFPKAIIDTQGVRFQGSPDMRGFSDLKYGP